MNDCNLCKYIISEYDSNKQTCSKWVNKDNFDIPCKPTGGEIGSAPQNESDNCVKVECPSHCQYPFIKDVYTDHPSEHYDNQGRNPSFRYLNDNPDALESYINNATNEDMIKEEYRQYGVDDYPENLNLKCGLLLRPEGENKINFPDIPEKNVLRQIIQKNIEISKKGIDWGALKETDKLKEKFETSFNSERNAITINDYTIPIAENGIELEWWERDKLSEEELKSPLPDTIKEYQTLENIHRMTGGILEYVLPEHTVDNMVSEEIYDWLMKNNLTKDSTKGTTSNFTMAKFFGIKTDEVTNRDFEICMNRIMMTEHDDEEYIRKINEMEHLTDLGDPKNRKELLYIEAKIIKFLIIDTSDVSTCLDIVYLTDEICKIGLTSNPTKLVGEFLKLNTDNVDDKNYSDKMRLITNRILKHLPNIIEKVIELSEYYESKKCNDKLHKNTKLLKEIHSNLFTQKTMEIKLPKLGVKEFFRDFEENIFTKIILLIFISYIITQLIKLFKVNVTI